MRPHRPLQTLKIGTRRKYKRVLIAENGVLEYNKIYKNRKK